MAGGTSAKSAVLVQTAISKTLIALKHLEFLAQHGNKTTGSKHTEGDPKIAAAVVALQALA